MYALLFCIWDPIVNGAIIDAFEYYIKILEYNRNFKLIIISEIDISYLFTVVENRYKLDDIDYRSNIIEINKNQLVQFKFDKILVLDYSTIRVTKGLINSKEIIVISDLHTEDPNFIYDKSLYNVSYYGEMPFVYYDVKYKIKCLFDRFRPLKKSELGYYINSPCNNDTSFIENLEINHSLPIYNKSLNHKSDFFELFHCYIYYHANKWFDPHPRLFLECEYYGKEIMYFNKFGIKDGSYYRYNDLCTNGIEHRFLNRHDEIIRQFI